MLDINDIEIGTKAQIMHYILHELEHANQEKIFYSNRKDDEAVIIKNSLCTITDTLEHDNIIERNLDFNDLLFSTIKSYFECMEASKRNQEFYKKNYNIIPFERMADIKSFEIISNILDLAEYKQVLYYYKARLEFAKLRGYEESKFPLLKYLELANKIDVLSELSFYDKFLFQMIFNIEQLSLDNKLYLGLHISDEEKEHTQSKVKKYLSRI